MNNKEVNEYREDLKQRVTRIETILERVEKHLDRLNGRVEENKNDLTMIRTVGSVGILVMPVIVSIIMRLL